uniref:V-set pre-B cell surrogate light chain 3 n=1 Tax=Anas platyrhynchos TaxID=8839 RepID=A0A8B9SKD2_ANAPL
SCWRAIVLSLWDQRCTCQAQQVLTQPTTVLVLPGQTARLSCTLSPQYNITDFGITWYQQRPGPARIPDRFFATKDLALNACILSITDAQEEDNGRYYCSLSSTNTLPRLLREGQGARGVTGAAGRSL